MGSLCPACYHGMCSDCEGQGCYCGCQLEDLILSEQRAAMDYEAQYGQDEGEPELEI